MNTGQGLMAVWNDLAPGHAAEFDAWYRRQHIPERLQQPGFLEARRYECTRGSPRYCAFYWLDSVAALATAQYRDRLAQPTRWTRRIMPWFRNMARTPCTIVADLGEGIGGTMVWMAGFGGSKGLARAPVLLKPLMASCCDDPAIVRIQFAIADNAQRTLSNPEQGLRRERDRIADWIVVIEGGTQVALLRAAKRLGPSLARWAKDVALSPCYRLTWRVDAREVPAPCADDEAAD